MTSTKGPTVLIPSPTPGPTPNASVEITWPSGWSHSGNDVYWPHIDGTLLVVNDWGDHAYARINDEWQSSTFPINTRQCFQIWIGSQPSQRAFARNCPEHEDQLYGVEGMTILSQRSEADLLEEIRGMLKVETAKLQLLKDGDRQPTIIVNDGLVALPVHTPSPGSTDEVFAAVAILDLENLKIVDIIDVQLPASRRLVTPSRQILALPRRVGKKAVADLYLIDGDPANPDRLWWGVWQLSGSRISLVGGMEFLIAADLKYIGPNLIADFDPYFVGARFIGERKLMVNFEGDSVFVLNLDSGNTEVLFSIGGISHSFAFSHRDYVALFFRGGRRAYIFKI